MNRLSTIFLYVLCIASLIVGPTPAIIPLRSAWSSVVAEGEELGQPYDELSPAQEQAMWAEIQHNLALLRSTGILAAPDTAQVVT